MVVLRAGWDSIRTTLSCQSVCFKGSCLPYTAKCNLVLLVDNAFYNYSKNKCGELNLARHVRAGQFTKTFRFGEDIFAVRVYGVL